jgi:mRNA interferase RelE/StbE
MVAKIDSLAKNPRPIGVKLLHGSIRRWRIRAGSIRAIYRIDDVSRAVVIVDAGPRKDIYRR